MIKAGLKEKTRETGERSLAETSFAVKIIAARQVTIREMLPVRIDIAREAAHDRPDTASWGSDGC
ncbi:MAG: hypothetical protein WBM59_12240 [Sedimenticolaceae bacterium]